MFKLNKKINKWIKYLLFIIKNQLNEKKNY